MKIQYKNIYIFITLLSLLINNALQAQEVNNEALINQDTIGISIEENHMDIGYDKQRREKVTSSISTVKGKDLEQNFNLNLGNTLYGRLAGATVTQGGSEPGISAPGISIRGLNTFGNAGSGPLYVIDGFVTSGSGTSNAFMQLVPEEIESISILKDASATAVYGARAANGVVLVTTKTGKEGPMKVSFTTRQGFNQAQSLPKFLGAYDYSLLYNEALANDGLAQKYTASDLEAYKNGSDPLFHPNVNWYDEVLQPIAPVASYDIKFTGGDKFIKYFVMANAINSNGLIKEFGDLDEESSNSKYEKYNFRSNLDLNITKNLLAEFKIGGAIERIRNPGTYNVGGTFTLLQQLPPNAFPVFNPNGSYGGTNIYANPVGNLLSTGFAETNTRTILASLKITQKLDVITKGLSVSGAIANNNYFESGTIKTKTYPRFSITKGANDAVIYSPATGQLSPLTNTDETLDQYRNITIQAFLNYNRTFGKSDISAMTMFNTDNITLNGTTANATDPYKHNSFSGRLTYMYDNRFIAEFSGSYMGTETFAPGKRYGFFPAGSVGYIISNESFLKDNNTLNFLKLRASYGLVGNDVIQTLGSGTRYGYFQTYGGPGYTFGTGNSGFGGFQENTIANPNITWEKEKTLNIGLDFTIFKNLHISYDYFNRDRYDILVSANSIIPAFTGIPSPNLNQGKTKSEGFDMSLRYNFNSKKQFRFFAEINGGYFENKIVFNAEAPNLNTQSLRTNSVIGQPFGLNAIGFYSADDILLRQTDPASVPGVVTEVIKAGDIKYQDIGGPNGMPDGIIDVNDVMAIGNPSMPNFTMGLHTGFKYKGFDADFVLQGVTGNTVYLGGNTFHAFQGNGQVGPIALNRWTPETAATADYPRLSSRDNLNNYQYSNFWQRDGSFIKLRSAEIGFTFPTNVAKSIKMDSVRFFLTGTNIFSIDKIEYGDPESLAGYPVMRTINMGINLQL
ncbi:TonB-dependent receptor [Flavobacterium circumlabens]|uniref:TonB-dependent receptor n=1 Tax=Flavobacterium circumlabens TaxID=2133765 RepID=A0A4Y7UF28_9FLAO|nr:TonB-dependent receptor [Flavobacterium circumlabens]TCN59043.1 TonB-linked SusC/RagA family outer membrane protein [Flavobacterium circumlabens]TEB44439.1 TonB-dependent receptor [Flavobacterium circumlabens]